jgi:hypothetical protein
LNSTANQVRCKHHAAAFIDLPDVPGLHVHVEGAVAVGVWQSGDAVHFRGVKQVLVKIRFVHE